MKRLVISVAIIGLFSGLCAFHVEHLSSLTETLIQQVESIRTNVERNNWPAAADSAADVEHQWNRHAFYLHTTLRHTDIDAIHTSLRELNAYLSSREDRAECLAVIAKLLNQLELLLEAEQPSIKNLL